MTEVTPAGWYPDSTVQGQQRWWDGAQWTEHVQAPYVAGAARTVVRAAAGVSANTPHIWIIVGLLVLQMISGIIYTLSIDTSAYMDDAMNQTLNGGYTSPYAQMLTPAYLMQFVLGFVFYAAWVLLAFFDYRELKQRGVPRPFHWAFAFIPWVEPFVYLIGRSIVARIRTGSGLVPMFVGIAIGIAALVIGMVLGLAMAADMMNGINYNYYGE